MKRYIYHLIALLAICMTSCYDDIKYEVIGEGDARITATVKFHPLLSSLEDNKSRTKGDAIKTIDNIQVVIYNAKNEFIKVEKFTRPEGDVPGKGEFTKGENFDMPDNINGATTDIDQSEKVTETATFNLTLPFGRYKMYAVANYDDLTEIDEATGKQIQVHNISTPDDLKSLKAKWNEYDIEKNNQMFGYFATDDQSGYDDAPIVTINRSIVNLNAWILRLASKVTIVYDGSGLKEGINIYIEKVSICDIPKECTLGFVPTEKLLARGVNGNCPLENELIKTPEKSTLYYKTVSQSGNDDELDDVEISDTDPKVDYKEWLCVNKSVEVIGAVQTKRDEKNNLKYETDEEGNKITHTENMPALFFYENCQGNYENYPDKNWYNKKPLKEDVYKAEDNEDVKKDRIKAGTFIEVTGFYVSNNPDNLSSGTIKYRFMLGQNTTYDYNAMRNRHYKLTLKFKGYANQPEWHIVYDEDNPGLFPPEEYYMSYLYNVRQEMPIRLTGHPTKVLVQIVENNWAPYDAKEKEKVAPSGPTFEEDPTAFRWNREVYEGSTYDYGLHDFPSHSTPYETNIINDPAEPDGKIPEGLIFQNKVTPIWVGFLALQAPSGFEDYNTPLPTGVYNTRSIDFYERTNTREGMKRYFYGEETLEHHDTGREPNKIALYENTYILPNLSSLSNDFTTFESGENKNRVQRNAYTAAKNVDGSYTIKIPMFTMPKDVGYLSGFSGNNPFEAYYRKAVLKITAYYDEPSGFRKLVKYTPIFQMRRIINPKAVWRTWDNSESFDVKLMVLNSANDTKFENLESNGEWSAWVASDNDDYTPSRDKVFTLKDCGVDGKVHGSTGSKIRFTILFNGEVPQNETRCGKVVVHYHGNNCEHSIFVRKGYNVPVQIGDNGEDKYWSSYAVFSFGEELPKTENGPTKVALKPEYENGTWTFPNNTIEGLKGTLTVNPLALGTLFKRGNYDEGIRIINNKTYLPLKKITGKLTLSNGTEKDWGDIYGLPLLDVGVGNGNWNTTYKTRINNWEWSPFISEVPEEGNTRTYKYDVPTIEDFEVLMKQGSGVGVMYADGAKVTADKTEDAFGFFNENNDIRENEKGMRGFIFYNNNPNSPNVYNQVFFPIGYSGYGRRTIRPSSSPIGMHGVLRYGAQDNVLSVERNSANQYRPISYNNPANPGVVYWAKKMLTRPTLDETPDYLIGFDLNFFDINIGPMDPGVSAPDYGDAIPIKPIVIERIQNPPAPEK